MMIIPERTSQLARFLGIMGLFCLLKADALAQCDPVFQESEGELMIEVESVSIPPGSGWEEQTENGVTFYSWEDADYLASFPEPPDTLIYRFNISRAGTYLFKMRSRQATDDGNPNSQNDVWVQFPGVAVYKNVVGGTEILNWFSASQNVSSGDWTWYTRHAEHAIDTIVVDLPAGEHEVWLAGRSNGFQIDKFVLTSKTDPAQLTTAYLDGLEAAPIAVNTGLFTLNMKASDFSGQICAGDTLTLVAGGVENVQWSTGQSELTIDLTPTEPGTLMGYVTTPDEVCNADTLNYSLEVLEVPHIVFDPARITIDSGQSVSLNPLITFSGDASLMWTDGATEVPREVSPATSTTYTLMATNPGTACSSQASVEVVIGEKPVEPIQASMPPVLTPNGDGINDVLAPLFRAGEDPKKYQLEIYNRQGALIFNQSATQPWDGGEAPDGVYYYILRNRENPVQKLKGAVLLQRTVRN